MGLSCLILTEAQFHILLSNSYKIKIKIKIKTKTHIITKFFFCLWDSLISYILGLTSARVTLAVRSTAAGMPSFCSNARLSPLSFHLGWCNSFNDGGNSGGLLHIRVHLTAFAVTTTATARTTIARHFVLRRVIKD